MKEWREIVETSMGMDFWKGGVEGYCLCETTDGQMKLWGIFGSVYEAEHAEDLARKSAKPGQQFKMMRLYNFKDCEILQPHLKK